MHQTCMWSCELTLPNGERKLLPEVRAETYRDAVMHFCRDSCYCKAAKVLVTQKEIEQ